MAQIISSIFGHQDIIKRLWSAIDSKRISSSYLFCGPSGVGKKKIAQAFIQKTLCLAPQQQEACGECSNCCKVEKWEHEEVLYIEPDGTQIKMSQTDEIHRFLNLQKIGKHRFIILNEAHLLNPTAGNSLLKILEEPPEHTTFFLIAPSDRSILKTLRSRSQIIYFSSLSFEDLKKHTHLTDWILRSSQGRMDILEQLQDPELEEVRHKSFQVLQTAVASDLKTTLTELKEVIADKNQSLKIISLWQQILRDILFYKKGLSPQIHSDQKNILERFQTLSEEKIFKLFEILSLIEKDIYGNIDKNLSFENFILELRTP